ncbi:adenosylcobinamide-GDP ribazoletransferase [Paenibacillus alkalitolerans]|uniref:adenosylcobinamide-GDP ribazoletransferase n=1 Tax=Paenibacillus alkalitolerans TaxID=2799335 RepID=UPI001F3911BE|nr:adenosylcobinamide-GDP ribazoletransferase [Paenibacillus alkalitolerans]
MRRTARNLINWGVGALAALQLMTRLPLPFALPWNDATGRRSVVFYPLAGAVVGALAGCGFMLLPRALPDAPSAALLLVLWIWVTGALHLDGLMDTADGLWSNRPRERMLEIMKDPRVGAMGVVAGCSALVLKFALLSALVESARAGAPNIGAAVAIVPVVSRAFLPWAVAGWPYAGGSAGMGASLASAGVRHAAASLPVAAMCAAVLFAAFGTGDIEFAAPLFAGGLAVAAAVGAFAAWRIARRLGGLTGDTYGALVECIELALLTALAALGFAP